MSLLLHVNYGSQFLILSLFGSKDFELISSVSARYPYLPSLKEREIFFDLLKTLERKSKHKVLLDQASPSELNLKKIVEEVVISGKFIPDFVSELAYSRKKDDVNKYITSERLIINWDFEKIDFIFGGKDTFVQTFEINWGEISNLKNIEKLLRLFDLHEDKFENFKRSFPAVDEENPFYEIFYGLILENLTTRLDRQNKWRDSVNEIVLTGDVISLWRNLDRLVALVASSIAYTGRCSFIIDSYNLFNSERIKLIEQTGEIADYFFVPEKLRHLKHSLISTDDIETPLVIEVNKVRTIGTEEKEFLKVERNKKETKIPLNGNFIIIDTRDFDYMELLSASTSIVMNTYKSWRRGMGLARKHHRVSAGLKFSPFIYNPRDLFRIPISKDFNSSVEKGNSIKRGEKLGEFSKTYETYLFDLASNFDVFEKFRKYVRVINDQLVDKGQVIAERDGGIGSKGLEMISPVHGKVSLTNLDNGIVRIDSLTKNKVISSPVSGEVSAVIPGSEMVITAGSVEFPVFELAGKDTAGEVIFDIETKNAEGKILFIDEKKISLFNLRKLLQVGTKGIIFESIEKQSWDKIRNFLLETELDFTICILAGFGEATVSEENLKRLKKFEWSFAKFSYDKKTIKFFLESQDKFALKQTDRPQASEFAARMEVRLRDLENWGEIGKIIGIQDDFALVELTGGRVELISLDNLE